MKYFLLVSVGIVIGYLFTYSYFQPKLVAFEQSVLSLKQQVQADESVISVYKSFYTASPSPQKPSANDSHAGKVRAKGMSCSPNGGYANGGPQVDCTEYDYWYTPGTRQ